MNYTHQSSRCKPRQPSTPLDDIVDQSFQARMSSYFVGVSRQNVLILLLVRQSE